MSPGRMENDFVINSLHYQGKHLGVIGLRCGQKEINSTAYRVSLNTVPHTKQLELNINLDPSIT